MNAWSLAVTGEGKDVPVEHIVRNELDIRRPVLLVEHVLEVRAREQLTRVVAWPAPRIE